MPRTKTVQADPNTGLTTFFNARYPNERVIYRDEMDAPLSHDFQFKNGRLAVYSQADAEWLRETLLPRNNVFEGKWEDGVTCPLCADKGREPVYLNAKALQEHMKLIHE